MSLVSSPPPPPALNNATKPKRSVSFMKHATVTVGSDSTTENENNTIMVPTGAPGNVHRSSFRPGRRPGYVRKGPVQSDSDADEESDDIQEEEEHEESEDEQVDGTNRIGSFNSQWSSTNSTQQQQQQQPAAALGTTTATTSRTARPGPGQNYVRRAPVNSDTESDEEKLDEPTRSSTTTTTSTPISSLNINKKTNNEEEESSDTDEELKNGGGIEGLMRPMAQTRISGPGQNYVRKAPVNSDSEDDEESDDDNNNKKSISLPAVNSPAPQQPPHSGGSIHNRHLNTVLGATTPGSGPHSRTASFDPYFAAASGAGGILPGVGGLSSALSSPRSAPVATSSPAAAAAAHGYSPYTPHASVGMTFNSNASNSSLGNLSSNNGSNPHLASSASSTVAAASLANSMAIYQQQQQEMMMIMQQQQLQIATMQQQQQAYQLLVLQQQQQHQQQLHAVQQQHSRAASANGSVHTLDSGNNKPTEASDSDDDVPLGEKQSQLPQLPQLPALPQFSSLLGASSPPPSTPTFTPASPTTAHAHYSPRLSVQQSPLLNHNRQVSSSSIHSINNGVGGAAGAVYLHQPISSSPLNPATSNAASSSSSFGLGQHQVYSGAHTNHQTSSQPRLSDFIEEEQDRLLREQHLQATAAALGGHSVTSSVGYNGSTSLLTSSFPAGYRGSVASVMSLQQSSGIDRGSMNSLHSAGSSGSSGSNGNGAGQHRPTPSRDSFIPQMATTLIQQQQYLTQQPHLLHQQPYLPYQQQPSTLIHVEAKPPPPSAGLVGAISAMERDKKLAKAHGTNQLQFQHQQAQQQMIMNAEKERWLQEQRRLAWEAGQFPQQQQQIHFQQGMGQQQMYYQQPGMMMQVPMMQQHQQAWTSADEEDDDKPLGAH
ncbi:hypothetical protein EC991_007970 [Linnemannia zychae]|nr:hypothetical protein EC991_007970 [Linnemannia zychae]